MARTIRVGIIGASAEGGWARDSHVPAVQGLEGLELVAVATRSEPTARQAAAAFGVQRSYASGLDLIRDPGVDLVTVATRVPDHRELVLAALAAGKHVYCEWPLGRGVGEAEEMARAARTAGLHAAIGLQLRSSAVTRRARAMIEDGAVGRLLSANARSATAGFGPDVPAPFVYLEDPANFVNLVTIQGAHTIDLAIALLGGLANLGALATAQYPMIRAGDDGAARPRSTFDHLLVQAQTISGCALSVEVAGGRPADTPFRFDLVGEGGVLRLEGGAARGVQAGRLKLFLNGTEETVDDGELAGMPDAAWNVAGAYAALRDDIERGTSTVAGFDHAVRLTRLVEDAFEASGQGCCKSSKGWPA